MPELILEPVMDPDPNKLEEAYEVVADLQTKVGGATVRVPKFFQFDGASIPAPAWQLIGTPFHPRLMTASVFHDWTYHTHQIKKKDADDLFYSLLLKDGVGKTRAWLMYEAVSTFGDSYWSNDDADKAYIKRLAGRIKKDGREPADYGIKPS
ncbi:MAG: DUF1353 domain-containing protein [Alphaproteobacteria bacterium]